jgi:hypothetical protein
MSDGPISLAPPPEGYADWLAELKTRTGAWPEAEVVQQAVGQLPWDTSWCC